MKKTLLISLCSVLFFTAGMEAQTSTDLASRLSKHVYYLASDSLLGRKGGSPQAKIAADYIAAQWKAAGLAPLFGDDYFQQYACKYANLAGIIEGSDSVLCHEYIVVGAHYDHLGFRIDTKGDTVVYNGADDNASGTAAVIELARLLQAQKGTYRRSIILLAFDDEESGLNGSFYFVNHCPVSLEQIKLMLSVDMIGWLKTSGKVEYEGTGTIINGAQWISDSRLLPPGLTVKAKSFENSIFTATDTQPFAEKGIATLAVTTGIESPYHKPEDDADLIDYQGVALITQHLHNLVADAATDPHFAPSGKIASKHKLDSKGVQWGLNLNLGTNSHWYTKGALTGKTAFSAGIGGFAQINLNRQFAIRPGLNYDWLRAPSPQGDVSTHNLTLPVDLVWKPITNRFFSLDMYLGIYYRGTFYGSVDGSVTDFNDYFYRHSGGFNMGMDLWLGNIGIGANYRNDFTDITRRATIDNAFLRNNTTYFSLLFKF
jgi:hypothetical protein